MAQLRLGLSGLREQDAEVLQVTHSTLDEARRYTRFVTFAFPYLCDPDRAVHERYGLPLAPITVADAARSTAAAATDLVLRGERTPLPLAFFARYRLHDSPQAVFVIDRHGMVGAAYRLAPNAPLPTPAMLVEALRGMA